MNNKKTEQKLITDKCPRCNCKLITIPLSPTQSCKMCDHCKWTNFGEE